MEIKIAGTTRVEELKIIDPKTGVNWVSDLIGRSTDLDYDEDSGVCIMQQVDFNWWENFIERYQAADDFLHQARCHANNPEHLDQYLDDMNIGAYELEDYPHVLIAAVRAWVSEQEKI